MKIPSETTRVRPVSQLPEAYQALGLKGAEEVAFSSDGMYFPDRGCFADAKESQIHFLSWDEIEKRLATYFQQTFNPLGMPFI